jgi:MFS family permease
MMADLVQLLRHRNFRFLWLAHSASIIGDGLVITALAIYVTQLTGDASDLGLVLAAAAVPLVAFTLIGGVWGDRLPRQRLMIATDLVRFALHATLACLIFFGDPQIWQIVVIELVFGIAEAFFRPAATGLMPQTVPEEEIQRANALMSTMSNIAEFAGPALATALVLGVGAGTAFAFDALTFLVSAAMLTQVGSRSRGASRKQAVGRGSFRKAMREGFEEVRSRVWVWGTLLAFSVALFCGLAPEFVLGPTIAKEQYGDIAAYGVFASSLGVGTIVGSVIGLRWRPHYPMRMAIALAALWPLSAIVFAAGLPLAMVIPATIVGGAAVSLFDVLWMTALSERIPADRLSRVSSFDWTISVGLLPLGYIVAGPIAESIGAVEVMVGGSALASIALTLALLPRETRMLERLKIAHDPPTTAVDLPRLPNP